MGYRPSIIASNVNIKLEDLPEVRQIVAGTGIEDEDYINRNEETITVLTEFFESYCYVNWEVKQASVDTSTKGTYSYTWEKRFCLTGGGDKLANFNQTMEAIAHLCIGTITWMDGADRLFQWIFDGKQMHWAHLNPVPGCPDYIY